jgi:hypothetical protein
MAMGYSRDSSAVARIGFRGGSMSIPFDHPGVNTVFAARVVVKIVGL